MDLTATKKIKDPRLLAASHNKKRSNTLSALKRKNINLGKQMIDYRHTNLLTEEQDTFLRRIGRDVLRCSSFALYREHVLTLKKDLIAFIPCGNKLCFVCNWSRQKRLRRKFLAWFKENPQILELYKPLQGGRKYTTATQYAAGKWKGYVVSNRHNYDLMHLSLTVPHTKEHGFKGEHFYFHNIVSLYNLMRKVSAFNNLVLGGIFQLETTENEDGLHIHIHSLLLVKQEKQNRNNIHNIVMKEWNRLTVDENANRQEFSPGTFEIMCKGNKLFSRELFDSLDPRGATLIGLDTIYTIDKNSGHKVRTFEFGSADMFKAIMEVISYNFKPKSFERISGTFDIDLISRIAPAIYRKNFYAKFGCLCGEKSLNIKEDETNLEEDYAETASLVNEDTGEMMGQYRYLVANPAQVYHIPALDYDITFSNEAIRKMKVIDAYNTSDAVRKMGIMVQSQFKQKR